MASNPCEVWLCVDQAGDYAVGVDAESARSAYAENIGALEDTEGHRMVKVIVTVPLPEVVELAGEAPATGKAVLTSVS